MYYLSISRVALAMLSELQFLVQQVLMGNTDTLACSEGCYAWISNLPQIHKKLRLMYRRNYEYCQIGRIALSTLRNFRNEGDLNDTQGQFLRKSIIDSRNYEENTLNISASVFGSQVQNPDNHLPSSIFSLSLDDKQRYLRRLIKESYILVDLSDMLEGNQRHAYEMEVKEQIFNNQQSILGSMAFNKADLQTLIKEFNPVVIGLLEEYVHFCEEVNKQFLENQQCYYFRLLLNLKAHVIQKNKYRIVDTHIDYLQKVQTLREDIDTVCQLLIDTICVQHDMFIDNEKRSLVQDGVSFYQEINLHTLVMQIIFNEENFHKNIMQFLQAYLKDDIKRFKQQPPANASSLLKALKEVNSVSLGKKPKKKKNKQLKQDINGNKANLQQLLDQENARSSNEHIFPKSTRMFSTINQRPEPIYRLKIFYELSKTIEKEFKQLFKEYNTNSDKPIPYTRQSITLIAKWLINKNKTTNNASQNLINILLTYWFIHPRYRESQKGSCLIPFVEESQTILRINQ